jgi:hypothetical protein
LRREGSPLAPPAEPSRLDKNDFVFDFRQVHKMCARGEKSGFAESAFNIHILMENTNDFYPVYHQSIKNNMTTNRPPLVTFPYFAAIFSFMRVFGQRPEAGI